MKQRGFTIVELLVVIAVIAILSTLATMAFNQMQRKQAVNDEIKMIYSDIASARADSLYQHRQRRVVLDLNTFSIYSSLESDSGVQPLLTKRLKYPIKSGTDTAVTFDFDFGGLLRGVSNASVCIEPPSDYGTDVDAIVVFTTRTTYGSWENSTGDCKRDYITLK